MKKLVRLLGTGTDEFNIGENRFALHSDGAFYVPEDIANVACDGVSGLYRAPAAYTPPEGSVAIEHVAAAVRGLEDGPEKTALMSALESVGHAAT